MFKKIILKWFSGILVAESSTYFLSYRIPEKHIGWGLKGRFFTIDALLFLKTDTIPFIEIRTQLFKAFQKLELQIPKRVYCTWIICSPRGGVYLYETLAVKEFLRSSRMKNKFLVINTEDGTVCLEPGHTHNKRYTTKTKDLLANIRTMTLTEISSEFTALLDECLAQKKA